MSEGLEPADTHTLAPLKAVVAGLDADLGGTEMAGALATVLALPVPAGRQADVILITDGEIYDIAGVIEMADISIGRAVMLLYAWWLALKAEYLGYDQDVEQWRPIFAAFHLYRKALDTAPLGYSPVVRTVAKKSAKKHRVKITTSTVSGPSCDVCHKSFVT